MMLKLESRVVRDEDETTHEWWETDYIAGYKRVTAKCRIGGRPEPDIVLGVQKPSPELLERQVWAPMEIMGWKDDTDSGAVDIIHVYLYRGDSLFLMDDRGNTLDRLF